MDKNTTFEKFEQGKKGSATKAARGPIRHIEYEPVMGGGVISTARHHESPGSDHKMLDYDSLKVKRVHKTPEEAANHLSAMLGGPKMVPFKDKESDPAVGGTTPDNEMTVSKGKKE